MTAPATVAQLRRTARLLRMRTAHDWAVCQCIYCGEIRFLSAALYALARERSKQKEKE